MPKVIVSRPKKHVVDDSGKVAERISVDIASDIQKKLGGKKGVEVPIYYGDITKLPTIKHVISTQVPNVDIIVARSTGGRYGFPCSRFAYVTGPEKSGKTTLCIHLMMEIQRRNGVVVYIESESAFDAPYAGKLGLDVERIIFAQPDTLEDCCKYIQRSTMTVQKHFKSDPNTYVPVGIFVDSISAFPTRRELDTFEVVPGEHARIISLLCRVLTKQISIKGILFFFVLQRRRKIGVTKYQDPDTFIGGDALKFTASVGIKMSRVAFLKDSDDKKYGIRSRIQTTYNKCLPPAQEAEIDIIWGKGFDKVQAMMDALITRGLIKKSGSWHIWKDPDGKEHKWQGTEMFEKLHSNSKLHAAMVKSLRIDRR